MNKVQLVYTISILFLLVSTACFVKKEGSSKAHSAVRKEERQKKEVVIFVYHRFGDERYPSTNIPIRIFEQHLQYLLENDFTVLSFGEAVDYINDATVALKKKVACITIDDGYKTFYTNALPLLLKFKYKATLFINSESVGGNSYMNWEQLKAARQQGIEIGNHSHSHAYFLNKTKDQQVSFFLEDVRKCQKLIRENLDFYPDIFAYPYGEFSPEMKSILKSEGFKAAAAQNSGVFIEGDNFAVSRFPMAGPYTKMKGFVEKVNMRALRIQDKNIESFVLEGDNPPLLEIVIDSSQVDLKNINCFTTSECLTNLEGNKLSIQATIALKNRRTLYTITAPSREPGVWHWYSHLWIRPEVEE